MSRSLELGVVAVAAITTGLMAGVYFTFSTFMMKSLNALEGSAGAAAMQSINKVIVASPFMPLFFGTSVISLGLAGWSVPHWGQPGSLTLFGAAATYLVGMFLVTAVFNVPLNDKLATIDLASPQAGTFWNVYLRQWTLWNHVRTLTSTLSAAGYLWALLRLS